MMHRRVFALATALLIVLVTVVAIGATHGVQARQGARAATASGPVMGTEVMSARPTFVGYYDAHKDTYLSTDVSNKAQATAMHINYSKSLGSVRGVPAIYLVQGSHVASQIAVFGSEPGAPDYSPLWAETIVTFKAGTKPILLTSDNQILSLAKKGKLSIKDNGIVLNCPIIKVGK